MDFTPRESQPDEPLPDEIAGAKRKQSNVITQGSIDDWTPDRMTQTEQEMKAQLEYLVNQTQEDSRTHTSSEESEEDDPTNLMRQGTKTPWSVDRMTLHQEEMEKALQGLVSENPDVAEELQLESMSPRAQAEKEMRDRAVSIEDVMAPVKKKDIYKQEQQGPLELDLTNMGKHKPQDTGELGNMLHEEMKKQDTFGTPDAGSDPQIMDEEEKKEEKQANIDANPYDDMASQKIQKEWNDQVLSKMLTNGEKPSFCCVVL